MSNHKKPFTPELRAIMVLFVFIIFAPIGQMAGYIIALQNWAQVESFLPSFWMVLKEKLLPAILPAYAQYMPASFLVGWYLRTKTLKGADLSLHFVMIMMLVVTLSIEAITQLLIVLLGAPFHFELSLKMFWLNVIQALISGILCWSICHLLKIDKQPN